MLRVASWLAAVAASSKATDPDLPPPRCMTVYADHTQDPDSILIPSTSGLRSGARVHELVPHTRNHSRQSSTSEDGLGWGTPPRKRSGLYGIATASSPQLSTPAPRRSSGRRTSSNVYLPPEPSSGYASSVQSPNVQTTYSPSLQSPNIQTTHSPVQSTLVPNTQSNTTQSTASNQYLSSPVRPILSSVPAEPSTPAYNLLSAIVTRTPGTATDSESEGRRHRIPPSESRSRLAPPTDPNRLTVDSRVPRIESQISPGLDKRPRHLSENDMGTRGDARDGGEGSGAGLQRSHSARVRGDLTPRSGTSSPSNSKPPTPSRTSTNSSVPHGQTPVSSPNRAGPAGSSGRGGPGVSSGVRHPFLAGGRRRSISTEDERALHRYRSADALRKILDDAAAKRRQEEEERERARLAAEQSKLDDQDQDQEEERGRKPLVRPTWSVIPRRGTTVAVETVAPSGTVSIEGITGTGAGTATAATATTTTAAGKGSRAVVRERQVDPLVLPGEFWVGPMTAEPRSVASRQDTLTPVRQDTVRQDTVTASTPTRQDTLTPTSTRPDSPTRQRSQSMGPVTRLSSLLPKLSVFGKAAGVGDPPPAVDKGKGKAVEDETKATDIPRSRKVEEVSGIRTEDLSKTPVAGPSFTPSHAARLSVQLNGAVIDPDADTTTSESETESQPSQASLPLPPRLFLDSTDSITRRPSSLRLPGSPPSLAQTTRLGSVHASFGHIFPSSP
ncbi:hypothetical protein OPQ81_004071 [Rhizoctonia solani]|nr:hypothetical protein OPQ81_004071 [Rhizoctonia solani]